MWDHSIHWQSFCMLAIWRGWPTYFCRLEASDVTFGHPIVYLFCHFALVQRDCAEQIPLQFQIAQHTNRDLLMIYFCWSWDIFMFAAWTSTLVICFHDFPSFPIRIYLGTRYPQIHPNPHDSSSCLPRYDSWSISLFSDKPIWRFPKMGIPPKSSILMERSIRNHPFLSIPYSRKPLVRSFGSEKIHVDASKRLMRNEDMDN